MTPFPRRCDPLCRTLSVAAWLALGAPLAAAQTPIPPRAPQPALPAPAAIKSPPPKAQPSPVVDSIAVGPKAAPRARETSRPARKRMAHRSRLDAVRAIDRPALAGVLLVAPVPPLAEPPRPIVPMPAYFVDGLVAAFTSPPPPLVCEPRRRDTRLPDPHLFREVSVACRPDVE